jgi:murein DD-endopeptidase MepM/ murein hydrolase activator NlpD
LWNEVLDRDARKDDMTTRRPTRARRAALCFGVLCAVSALGAVAGTTRLAGAADADPAATRRSALVLAQERLDAARAQAEQIAGRMAAAQTQQAKLAADIAAAEAEIPQLRAHAAALRDTVRTRAVRLYIRGGTAELDAAVSTGTVLDAARAAHLTKTIGNHDVAVASELVDTARELETREARLRTQRDELDRSITSLVPLRDLLDKRLTHAAEAYAKVKSALADSGKLLDVASGAQACPVNGFVVFTDDFGQPRDGATVHEGIDMPAKEGTPVVAVVDGLMGHDESPAGGHGIWLLGNDDVAYYYAHLSRYEGDARLVKAGDVIGAVGSTGVSTGPHLHFEVHPHHDAAVDGFPLLLGLCAEEINTPRG